MQEPSLPFFISRDPGVGDPGEGADAGVITWIEVGGDRARLERWLGPARLPVGVVEGPTRADEGRDRRPQHPGSDGQSLIRVP